MRPLNRIALIDLEGRLVTTSPQGNNRRVLTQNNQLFQFPAWSPDGNYIAAIGSDRMGSGVFVLVDREPAEKPAELFYSVTNTPIYLYWSPDSRRVSFIANHSRHGFGLHLAPAQGGKSRLLATGQPFFWDWLPDGSRILIHTNVVGPDARLAFINPNRPDDAANVATPGLFQAPGIAPSGQRWAYAESDDPGLNQLVIESHTPNERVAIPYEGAIALGWSPARDQLAYVHPPVAVQRFYGPLYLFDAATQDVSLLVEATVLAFFWSPDGTKIAYLILSGTEDDFNPETITQVATAQNRTRYTNGRQAPRLLDDTPFEPEELSLDLWVVDINTGNQQRLITFDPSPLLVNQFLPFFDQYALSHRLWSPASDALVLPIVDGETPRVVIIPADGGPLQPLAKGIMAFWSHQ